LTLTLKRKRFFIEIEVLNCHAKQSSGHSTLVTD